MTCQCQGIRATVDDWHALTHSLDRPKVSLCRERGVEITGSPCCTGRGFNLLLSSEKLICVSSQVCSAFASVCQWLSHERGLVFSTFDSGLTLGENLTLITNPTGHFFLSYKIITVKLAFQSLFPCILELLLLQLLSFWSEISQQQISLEQW